MTQFTFNSNASNEQKKIIFHFSSNISKLNWIFQAKVASGKWNENMFKLNKCIAFRKIIYNNLYENKKNCFRFRTPFIYHRLVLCQ